MPFEGSDFCSCRHVPQLDGAILCRGSQPRPIRRKYHRIDIRRMPFEGSDFFLCRPVPQLDGAILCRGSQPRPIRRKYHRIDPRPMPFEGSDFCSCCHVPQLDIPCRGSQPRPIRRKYHRIDLTCRGYQREFTGRRHIVQPHANATCHSEALTIRRKRNVSVTCAKAAFAQACDCAVGQMPRPILAIHAAWRVRRSNDHHIVPQQNRAIL